MLTHQPHRFRRLNFEIPPAPKPAAKTRTRKELTQDVEAHLAKGGHIREIPPGVSAYQEGSRGIVVNTYTDADRPRTRPRRDRQAKPSKTAS